MEISKYQWDEELVCCVCGEVSHLDYDVEIDPLPNCGDVTAYMTDHKFTCAKCREKTTATEEGCPKCGADKGECLGC